MATTKTPAELAAAAAKRAATRAANKAAGVSVRAQRAAAKAAKTGQPYTPPAPKPPSSPNYGSYAGTARSRARRRSGYYNAPTTPQPSASAPLFSTPKTNYRALQLVVLASVEALFVQKLQEQGITQEARDAYDKYKKLKALALAPAVNVATQTEANSALRMAIVHLIKLT